MLLLSCFFRYYTSGRLILFKQTQNRKGASPMAQWVKNLPAMQETQEMWVQSLGQEDPLEEENGNQLQHSCLKNPMKRGAWWATVQRVTKVRYD